MDDSTPQTTTIGILGVGRLAQFIVQGLAQAGSRYEIVLSPRNAEAAHALSDRFGAKIAADNQAVADAGDIVLVCLPAENGERILSNVNFRENQTVLSAIAGLKPGTLAQVASPAKACCTMMPGHANALGVGPSLLYPADSPCEDLLECLGPVHVFPDIEAFAAACVFGAFSGASFFFMNQIMTWFEANGVAPDVARKLVADTLSGNAEVVRASSESMSVIIDGVATPGGISRQCADAVAAGGGFEDWSAALNAVHERLVADSN